MEPDESPTERYRRELRDLVVAAIDFKRLFPSPPPTQNPGLRSDLILVAEHISDTHLGANCPAEPEALAARVAVADDIIACLEHGRSDLLRPTEEAVRVVNRWWYEMSWLGRAWHVVVKRVLIPVSDFLWNRFGPREKE